MKEPGETLVLVVDDDETHGQLLQFILNASGYRAVRGRSGSDAVRMAKTLNPDLVLLNLLMPGKNGWVTFREIRRGAKTKHIKAILFSADVEQLERCRGADGTLTSPIKYVELLETISQALMNAPPVE